MNCKPGDLAIFVRGKSEAARLNLGKIVEVLGPSKGGIHHGQIFTSACDQAGAWFVRSMSSDLASGVFMGGIAYTQVVAVKDSLLRPIRNEPGEDETLQWLDVPSNEKQAA